ncbi:THAP domain-containing protein 1-like [Ornithodoros turicata]|uniref:THAP domain-containing protein 1-like n=1 Tax=Ornithodoros turicata TaxID=34597 RepID=UPI0031391D30
MPCHCCVPVCRQRGYLDENGQKVSFHRFPKSIQIRKQWIVAIKRDPGKEFRIIKNTKVCSLHFRDDDFVNNVASGLRILRDNAVPSVFAFSKPKKQRKPPKSRPFVTATTVQQSLSSSQPLCAIENLENLLEVTPEPCPPEPCRCNSHEELQQVKAKLAQRETEITKLQRELEGARATITDRNDEIMKIQAELNNMTKECASLQQLVAPFSLEKFKSSKDDISFYTGLPSYEI